LEHQLVVCEPGGAPRGRRAPRGLRLNKHMVLDFLLALADAVRRAGLASDAHPDPVTANHCGRRRAGPADESALSQGDGDAGPVFAGSAVCGERPSNKSPDLGHGRQRGHASEPGLANDSGTKFTDGG
jgi:hypothetical protein